ncbi:MAG: lyase family protein, partial [Dehalococcoidia bacterium]|nr:lyase family protein [Dehalococcoidia bacterium]
MASQEMRLERDSMGELEVPANAYYGGNTRRAELNFPISNLRLGRSFVKAIGQIKQSAAVVNLDLEAIDRDIADAIIAAAQRVIDGEFDDQFVVDVFQTGSGTSTNMNANEVISNVAIESLGGELGSRDPVHPNDHVNKGQSSNDVIPTTIHLAAAGAIHDNLIPALKVLEDSLRAKSEEFWDVVKTGRTHLQDATPIRLGQQFLGYAGQLEFAGQRAEKALA